jgi:hypothetical protein
MGDFKKRGVAKRTNGKYTNNEGIEKTRYVTVGDYYASDGGNRKAVKLYATAFSEEQWLNIYEEEPEEKSGYDSFKEQGAKLQKDEVILPNEEPISSSDIPF